MSDNRSEPAVLPAPVPSPLADSTVANPPSVDSPDRQGLAVILMCGVALLFAIQDGVSRHLGTAYSPVFVVMLRYWFFAVFVTLLVMRNPGGLRRAIRSKRPWTQIFRGIVLALEVIVMIESFVRLGLINTHAIFACTPLIVVALSGPILGERIGWRRWLAVGIGFAGILIVLKPDSGVFTLNSLLPFIAALLFATYQIATRHVARDDPAIVSFFWTGIFGAVAATLIGMREFQPIALPDWPWLALLCILAAIAHYLLIRAYELAEASSLQPFSYTQLVWVSFVGFLVFGETLAPNVVIGATIIVGAGLFTWWREHQRSHRASDLR